MYYLSFFSDYAFFSYISVRAGFAFFCALFLCLFLMPKFINFMKLKKASQPIYELAPQTHQKKCETPTMGGLVFIFCTIIASLLSVRLDNIFAQLGILCLILFCVIGFLDDFYKIAKKNNHSGLSPRIKMLFLIIASLICCAPLYFSGELSGEFFIPFYKYSLLNLEIFALLFWSLVFISSANAVNLTDGLDGLAVVPSIFAIVTLGILLYFASNVNFSTYLFLPKIQGISEVVIICAALLGALLGFLWFNCYPAQIFMGDSGSLTIGAFIAYLAVISKNEILLLLIGFVFVMETLSVILQVGSFKIFHKRIFQMAPIHHHFEKKGWMENKIIVRFWIIALITNLLALATLKLR